MWRAMMLCDVIGEKASFIGRRRDFQSIAILLAQAPARVIQMIKNAETGSWQANALHTHTLFSASPTALPRPFVGMIECPLRPARSASCSCATRPPLADRDSDAPAPIPAVSATLAAVKRPPAAV